MQFYGVLFVGVTLLFAVVSCREKRETYQEESPSVTPTTTIVIEEGSSIAPTRELEEITPDSLLDK